MSSSRSDVIAALKKIKTAVITSHISPDGDAIGSAFGLALGLQSLGVETTVYFADTPSQRYLGLIGNTPYTSELPKGKFDAAISVDTSTKRRIGPEAEAFGELAPVTINIDHHISNGMYANFNLVVPSPSTAQILFKLLIDLEARIDPFTANLFLAGLMDDTGSFRFQNANQSAFDDAMHLLRFGANPNEVARNLYYTVPERALRLRAAALTEMKIFRELKLATVRVSTEMLNRAGATSGDTEGIVDDLRSVEGVDIAVSMRETDTGWKCSLRSEGSGIDVNQVAKEFGGGGHTVAAGCVMQGSGDEVEQSIVSAIRRAIESQARVSEPNSFEQSSK